MSHAIAWNVGVEDSGARLDRFVVSRVEPQISRRRVQQLIQGGQARLNGAVEARPATRLSPGDLVSLEPPPETPAVTTPSAAPELTLDVIYEDAAVVVVDKPAGIVVHPAIGHAEGTLVNALLARYPDLAAAFADQRPGIVHRLDRDTSGVMVVARTPEAAAELKRQFGARMVEKTYLALVKGRVAPEEGIVDAPIGRDARHRKRMAALPSGRAAQTRYRVLGTVGDYTWLEAYPLTGRTHQIRVHFDAIGHPVAGDPIYGRRDDVVPRLALHAWRLVFHHPASGARTSFRAPLADDLRVALAVLGVPWEEAPGEGTPEGEGS